MLRRDDDGAPTSVGIFNSRGSWFPREKRFTAEPQSSRRDAKGERVSEVRGCRMKRNAEAERAQRKTLSWVLKVWSADL